MEPRDDSEYGAEQTQDDAFVGEAPAGDETPGEYQSNDQSGGTSEETGVTYDFQGEPETTPNDEEIDKELVAPDPEASNAGTSAEAE